MVKTLEQRRLCCKFLYTIKSLMATIRLQNTCVSDWAHGCAEPHCSIGLENRRSLVRSPARPIFFPRIDDSHCERIHSSLTAVRCFENRYVGKQPVFLERILCGVPVKRTSAKHGYVHWPPRYN